MKKNVNPTKNKLIGSLKKIMVSQKPKQNPKNITEKS